MSEETKTDNIVDSFVENNFQIVVIERNGKRFPQIQLPDAVAVIALTENNEILIISEVRGASAEETKYIPAGTMEKGETPIETANREFWEESWYKAKSMEPFAVVKSKSKALRFTKHGFIATGLTYDPPEYFEGEPPKVFKMKLDEVQEILAEQEIDDDIGWALYHFMAVYDFKNNMLHRTPDGKLKTQNKFQFNCEE